MKSVIVWPALAALVDAACAKPPFHPHDPHHLVDGCKAFPGTPSVSNPVTVFDSEPAHLPPNTS